MIKFFRRIRQRLVTENKFSKYLIYAIGEIVLVVIGILIALQINLWQEERNDRSKECVYYGSLISDLQDQIRTIDEQIVFESEVIRNSELLITSYNVTNAFLVDKEFSRRIGTLNNRVTFRSSVSTYQELLSTGNMSIVSEQEVKSLVLSYYQKLGQFEDIISKNNAYVDNHFAPSILEISTHSTPNLQIDMFKSIISKGLMSPMNKVNQSDLPIFYREIQKQLDEPLRKLKVINDIQYRYRISGVHLSLMDLLKNQTNDLVEILENELNKCEED